MKTLKVVQSQKLVTWSLMVMFSFLQIMPAGLAANAPVDELQARSVPASVAALTNVPEAAQPAPAPQKPVVPEDSIAFQLGGNPLSPATSVTGAVTKVKSLVDEIAIIPSEKRSPDALTQEEIDEVSDVLKNTPASKKSQQSGACTNSMPPNCWSAVTTQYFDSEGNLIGSKMVRTNEPAIGEHTTTTVWSDANGKVVILEKTIPPAVQQYIDALKKQLGSGFYVTAGLKKDGTYIMRISVANPCRSGTNCAAYMPPMLPGSFESMSFSVSAKGELNRDSIKANYVGQIVDGKLLYDTMAALEASFHPDGSAWMPPPYAFAARLAQLASQIRITSSLISIHGDSNVLLFDHNGQSYKAYRDATGKVILERVLPPAVQKYIDELKKQLGAGFNVTATLQKDGTYLVTVADMKKYFVKPTAGLKTMSFSLLAVRSCAMGDTGTCTTGYAMDPQSLQVTYYGAKGDIKVNGALLFEGLRELLIRQNTTCDNTPGLNSCTTRFITDQETLAAMAKISGVVVDPNGAINFAKDGKNYKVYRDATGKVIVEEVLSPAVQAIQKAVKLGLMNTFGFSQAMLDQLIKDGKIMIKVDQEKLTPTVTIDPSVKLPDGAVNLTDPLGSGKLPTKVNYKLGMDPVIMNVCLEGANCIGPTPTYYLSSFEFQLGNKLYVGSYTPEGDVIAMLGDNILRSVKVYDVTHGRPTCGIGVWCPPGTLVRELTFSYVALDNGHRTGPESLIPLPQIRISIKYFDGSQGEVTSRLVTVQKMPDGQYHIQTVVDKNAAGNVVANSRFEYLFMSTMRYCPKEDLSCNVVGVVLSNIHRTDANGKELSLIDGIGQNKAIFHRGNQEIAVQFESLEDLLNQALKLEAEPSIPPAVQQYVDALKKQLGAGFDVTATLQKDGTYLMNISRAHPVCRQGEPCVSAPLAPGTFESMTFSVSANGELNRDSIEAHYNGFSVDGKFLYEAMGALESSFHPEGSAWMPPPHAYTARLVQLASQIKITSSLISIPNGAPALMFDYNGTSYKSYRDATGKVVVEKVLPPAVQKYVDALKKQLGEGFNVTAMLQEDGTYLMNISRAHPVCRQGEPCVSAPLAPGTFESMSFSVSAEGEINRDSIKANFNGVEVVGKMLFDAMAQLQALLHPANPGQMPSTDDVAMAQLVKLMTEITITGSGPELLKFDHGTTSYRGVIIPWNHISDAQIILYRAVLAGAIESWYNTQGVLDRKVYVSGEFTGRVLHYYPDGKTLRRTDYEAGNLLYVYTENDSQGRTLKVGLKDGSTTSYTWTDATHFTTEQKDANGVLMVRNAYEIVDGQKHLLKAESFKNGNLQYVSTYTWTDATHYAVIVRNLQGTELWRSTGEMVNGQHRAQVVVYPDGSEYRYVWADAKHFERTKFQNGTAVLIERYEIRIINGKQVSVLLERLSPAVAAFVDALRKALGEDFTVKSVLKANGTYEVTVIREATCDTDGICYAVQTPRGLMSMSFILSASGQLDGSTLKTTYRDLPKTFQIDGKLLFEGLHELDRPFDELADQNALVNMAKLIVTSVDSDHAIHFTLEGKNYKACGNGILEEEKAVSAELLAKAKAVLGESVEKGVYLARVWANPLMEPVGAGTVSNFYNAAGDFMGSYFTNSSLGPNNHPVWRDAKGDIIPQLLQESRN